MNKKQKILTIILLIISIIIVIGLIIYGKKQMAEAKEKIDIDNFEVIHTKFNVFAHEKDIKFEEGKKNIYFFWGDGCPHCRHECYFLDKHYDELKKYYNIYGFETWYNEDNVELLTKILKEFDEEPDGVPLIIIGDKKIIGYGEESKKELIKYLKDNANNDNYDDKYLKVKEKMNE